jgi:hypothetical protein
LGAMGATPSGACLPEGPTAGRPTAPRLQPRHGRPARVLRPPARAAPLSPGPTTAEDPPPWLFGYFPNSGMASPREPGVESPVSGPGPTAGGKSAARPERAGHNPLPRFRPGAAVVRNPVPGGLVISLNIGLASRGQPGSLRTATRQLCFRPHGAGTRRTTLCLLGWSFCQMAPRRQRASRAHFDRRPGAFEDWPAVPPRPARPPPSAHPRAIASGTRHPTAAVSRASVHPAQPRRGTLTLAVWSFCQILVSCRGGIRATLDGVAHRGNGRGPEAERPEARRCRARTSAASFSMYT